MKKFTTVLGATLLEVMLVLAVAAMIIVMSVKYYQSATTSQTANSTIEMIQAITAAADGLAQGTGSYSGGGVATGTIQTLMPNSNMTAPWGGSLTIGSVTATSFVITVPTMPAAACQLLTSKMAGDPRYSVAASCATVTFKTN